MATPNFATVNAIAPNAPIGASATTTCTTLNTSSVIRSSPVRKATAALTEQQQPDAAEQRQDEHLQHVAGGKGADETVGNHVLEISGERPDMGLGIAETVSACCEVACATPAPGCTQCTTTRLNSRQSVVTASK